MALIVQSQLVVSHNSVCKNDLTERVVWIIICKYEEGIFSSFTFLQQVLKIPVR